ncbi:hypothetical protein M407DRAFT_111828 [Tulasnella calospora MUT 4182]|uniref:PHP domain-like protein n=1 Tax=Tulasnella calospora MUT 4182 TaxID=1051891 RepID=A0A0C3MEP4_9AGAM|nr:hypothetical protein M407DRAFT_111828 [Tulasnella calospora MUT 4182]
MYFDLNVPVGPVTEGSKKGKAPASANDVDWSERDQAALDARLDVLAHLGYTVVALNQTIRGVFNPATHKNTLLKIRERKDITVLRRLTIILTEDSEKGFGLVNGNTEVLKSYDIIALCPTTTTAFSLACLTHTVPSPIAAHIITFDLHSAPRLPFFLKLSTLKAAVKNGAVFEIPYFPVVKRGMGDRARRNWWSTAKEVVRVLGGKGLIFSGGGYEGDIRGPKDVINLSTILGCKQDQGHHAMAVTPKSLLLRAQTRQTYRAVLSEPRLVMPDQLAEAVPSQSEAAAQTATQAEQISTSKKRALEDDQEPEEDEAQGKKKKKKRKDKQKEAP